MFVNLVRQHNFTPPRQAVDQLRKCKTVSLQLLVRRSPVIQMGQGKVTHESTTALILSHQVFVHGLQQHIIRDELSLRLRLRNCRAVLNPAADNRCLLGRQTRFLTCRWHLYRLIRGIDPLHQQRSARVTRTDQAVTYLRKTGNIIHATFIRATFTMTAITGRL